MFVLNRSALILAPKQPFLEWLLSCPDPPEISMEDLIEKEGHVYLLPEVEDNVEAALAQVAESVLEAEFSAWYTDPFLWPARRDLEALLEHFDIYISSMVVDAADEEVVREAR